MVFKNDLSRPFYNLKETKSLFFFENILISGNTKKIIIEYKYEK